MSTTATVSVERPKKLQTGSCVNCYQPFKIPANVRKGKKRKKFCSDNCRKEFWINKGVSIGKLKTTVERWVDEKIDTQIGALEGQLRALRHELEVLKCAND